MSKCWKYKLLKPYTKKGHIVYCCVGCKHGSNMRCNRESLKEKIRKRLLNWLLGTDNVQKYTQLLDMAMSLSNERINLVNDHINTLNREKDTLETMKKMIKVYENHGINIDKEIKEVE